jgi:AcrR family transcriptional regulator
MASGMGTPKNPFESRDVLSRRGGPVKEPLSRDRIVAEALRLLSEEGLEGMSLRKVAAALETGPASLYAYVDDLQSLQALVLDRALAAVDVSGARRRGWRERVKAVLYSYVTVLIERRGLAQLALSTIAVGPHALRIVEGLLGLLEEGGLERATAAWSVDLLLLYATAIAAEQSRGHDPANPEGPLARAIAGVQGRDYPRVHAARDDLLAGEGEDRFSWAIEVLVSGMLQCPAPATSSAAAGRARNRRR